MSVVGVTADLCSNAFRLVLGSHWGRKSAGAKNPVYCSHPSNSGYDATEKRTMHFCIQILCRFQKSNIFIVELFFSYWKQCIIFWKSFFGSFQFQYVKKCKPLIKMMEKKLLLQKPILKFLVLRGKKEELLAYIFGIYIKFGHKNPWILTPFDSVDIAT